MIRTVVALLVASRLVTLSTASELSPLGSPPDWSQLDPYQETIAKDDFIDLLERVYAIDNAEKSTIRIRDDHAMIKTGLSGDDDGWYPLRFAKPGGGNKAVAVARYWRPASALGAVDPKRPLRGLKVALDPGHLGGKWARMEERWYQLEAGDPVKEGEMTLLVAKLLKPKLESAGAIVSMVRDRHQPTTQQRPKDFSDRARADLKRMGVVDPRETYAPEDGSEQRHRSLQWHQEKYFYRTSEIRARAVKVNERIKPDIVLCIHFNAEAWGDPNVPAFVPRNHFHILVNGGYSVAEIGRHDERFEMLRRILQRTHAEEAAASALIANALARRAQLPAFDYITNNVKRFSRNPYLYARNLMANRLFECPVVYLEPYVMNHQEVFERVQAGHYKGTRSIGGRQLPSLYEEYAQGVYEGMMAYYRQTRPKS